MKANKTSGFCILYSKINFNWQEILLHRLIGNDGCRKKCAAGNEMNIRYCNMFNVQCEMNFEFVSSKWLLLSALLILLFLFHFFLEQSSAVWLSRKSCESRSFHRLNDECICALTESDRRINTLVFWLQFSHFHMAQFPSSFFARHPIIWMTESDDWNLCSDFFFLSFFSAASL